MCFIIYAWYMMFSSCLPIILRILYKISWVVQTKNSSKFVPQHQGDAWIYSKNICAYRSNLLYLFIWLLLETNSFHKRRKPFIRNSNHLHLKSIIYSKHFILCIFLSLFLCFSYKRTVKIMQLRSESCDQMMLKNVLNTQNVTDDLKTKNQLRHVIRKES